MKKLISNILSFGFIGLLFFYPLYTIYFTVGLFFYIKHLIVKVEKGLEKLSYPMNNLDKMAKEIFKYDFISRYVLKKAIRNFEESLDEEQRIENMKNNKDCREIFNFLSSYTKDDIKKRYRELAKIYHPDISGQHSANDFIKLTECKNKLLKSL